MKTPVLGITGTGGAGKSSLVDELVRRFLIDFENKTMAIVSVDPSKRKTGGALLGDRIRMNAIDNEQGLHAVSGDTTVKPCTFKACANAIDIVRLPNLI